MPWKKALLVTLMLTVLKHLFQKLRCQLLYAHELHQLCVSLLSAAPLHVLCI